MAAVTTERTPAAAPAGARPRRRGQAPAWRWAILLIAGLYFLLPPPVPAATGVSPAPRLGARSMVAKLHVRKPIAHSARVEWVDCAFGW
jgi:hypothetical protein